jgi:hypothetical protein
MQCTVGAEEDPEGVLAWLEERIAAITQLPVQNGEVRALP